MQCSTREVFFNEQYYLNIAEQMTVRDYLLCKEISGGIY